MRFKQHWFRAETLTGTLKHTSAHSEVHRNPLFGVLYVGKNMYLGRMSEKTRFPCMVYTHFYAAAALAGDDSPGRQCT